MPCDLSAPRRSNRVRLGSSEVLKRSIDIVLSAIGLVVLVPLFAVIAMVIRFDSPGPALFRDIRIGRRGKPFLLYKFRTMVQDAQVMSPVVSTPNDDPRITRVGKVLRKYNLDELLQLLNVLKGDMSIVGPRPEVPQYVALFSEEEREILTMRPGIADWATLWVRDKGKLLEGSTDPERDYIDRIRPIKLRLQLEYVRRWSLWEDFVIMVKTFRTHFLDRFSW